MLSSLSRLVIAALAVVSAALAVTAAAGASPSIPIAGTALQGTASLSVRSAGGNLILDGTGTHVWTGSFTGTSVIAVHFVEHSDGTVTYQAFLTFTGTTPCGTGTVHFVSSGSGPLPGPVASRTMTVDEADATVPIHATLDGTLFLGPAGADVTYTGSAHCD